MATFRAGQRVKALGSNAQPWEAEGTIIWKHSDHYVTDDGAGPAWLVDLPGHIGRLGHCRWVVLESYLVPLTDPKADAFIESIKKMKPYTEPTVKAREALSSCSSDRTNIPQGETE